MNYNKLYRRFIESRSQPIGYFEKHHILPKSLNGNNSKENLINLTAREHYIAHLILVRVYGCKMRFALWRLVNHPRHKIRVPARVYQKIKLKWREARSIEQKDYFKKNPEALSKWRRANNVGNKNAWADPKKKKARIDAMKKAFQTEEHIKKKLASSLKAWQERKASSNWIHERAKRSQSAKLMLQRRKELNLVE